MPFIKIGKEECSVGTIAEKTEESFGIEELVLVQADGFKYEERQVKK